MRDIHVPPVCPRSSLTKIRMHPMHLKSRLQWPTPRPGDTFATRVSGLRPTLKDAPTTTDHLCNLRPVRCSPDANSRSRRCHSVWHEPRSNWMRRESPGAHFTLKLANSGSTSVGRARFKSPLAHIVSARQKAIHRWCCTWRRYSLGDDFMRVAHPRFSALGLLERRHQLRGPGRAADRCPGCSGRAVAECARGAARPVLALASPMWSRSRLRSRSPESGGIWQRRPTRSAGAPALGASSRLIRGAR